MNVKEESTIHHTLEVPKNYFVETQIHEDTLKPINFIKNTWKSKTCELVLYISNETFLLRKL